MLLFMIYYNSNIAMNCRWLISVRAKQSDNETVVTEFTI